MDFKTLHLQLRKLTKKQRLKLQALFLVFLLQIVLVIFLFFTGSSKQLDKKITLHATPKRGAKIVYLPLYRSIPSEKRVEKHTQPPSQAQVKNQQRPAQEKPAAKPVPPQQQPKKTTEKKEAVQKALPVKKAPVTTVKKESPLAKTPPQKKPEPAPIKKQVESKQLPAQQSEQKKSNDIQKTAEPAQQKSFAEEVALPETISLDQEVMYVGQQERVLIEIQQHLQQELEQCWKAPKITAADATCDLGVAIDGKGKAQKVTIIKSSGAKMYDMLAQKAFRTINYPRQLWGKEITFTFKGQ